MPIMCGATLIGVAGLTVAALGGNSATPSTPPATEVARAQPTRDTAVAVAVRALYELTIPAFTDRRRFADAVAALAAPGMQASVNAAFGDIEPEVIEQFERRSSVLRGAPLGYRIDEFHDGRASVAIWNVAIASTPGQPAQSQWRTLVVDLVWTERGWRVTNGTGVDGPAPSTPQTELAAEAAGFRSFRHVP